MGRGGARLSVVMVGSKGALLSRIQQVVRALGQTTRASAATVRAVVDVGGAGRRSSVQIRQEQGQCNYKLARRWVTSPTGRVTPFRSFDGTCHAALSSSGRIRCHVSAAAVVPRITFLPLRRSTLAVPGRRWLTGGAVAHWVTLSPIVGRTFHLEQFTPSPRHRVRMRRSRRSCASPFYFVTLLQMHTPHASTCSIARTRRSTSSTVL
jgi:hypothetical protein